MKLPDDVSPHGGMFPGPSRSAPQENSAQSVPSKQMSAQVPTVPRVETSGSIPAKLFVTTALLQGLTWRQCFSSTWRLPKYTLPTVYTRWVEHILWFGSAQADWSNGAETRTLSFS